MPAFQLRSDGQLEQIDEDGSRSVISALVMPETQSSTAPVASAATKTERAPVPLRPRDVVRAAKSRRAELRAEIKKLERLKRELSQLDRLIQAADGKSFAPVREIKRSAS